MGSKRPDTGVSRQNDAMKQKTARAVFVSILLHEKTNISQLSTFSLCPWKRTNVTITTPVSLMLTLTELLTLVAKTCGSCPQIIVTSVLLSIRRSIYHATSLQAKERKKYPQPLFVHCYNRVLITVLQQSVNTATYANGHKRKYEKRIKPCLVWVLSSQT